MQPLQWAASEETTGDVVQVKSFCLFICKTNQNWQHRGDAGAHGTPLLAGVTGHNPKPLLSTS